MRFRLAGLLAGALAACSGPAAFAALTCTRLTCEHRPDGAFTDRARPRLGWQVRSSARGARQTGYRILVATSPTVLAQGKGDLWDTGKVVGPETIDVAYGGKALRSKQQCFWKVQSWDEAGVASEWSKPSSWTEAFLDGGEWKARWIGCVVDREKADNPTYLPAPMFRKEFGVTRPVKRAVVYATAAGLYELMINGKRVSGDLFTPGWTEYAKRIYYQAFDVTSMLARGRNAMGAMVGDGWYGLHHGGRGRLALKAQLEIEYRDGSTEVVATGASWKATDQGPVRSSDIYNGESYDARREMQGWSLPGYGDSAWRPATLAFTEETTSSWKDVTEILRSKITASGLEVEVGNTAFGDPAFQVVKVMKVQYRQNGRTRRATLKEGEVLKLEAGGGLTIVKAEYGADAVIADLGASTLTLHPGSPVRVTGTVKPVTLKEPKPGAYTYDLGQNFTGWARLRLSGPAGSKVTARFAEMLNPDGTIYTTNLRGAKATDTVVLAGKGTETWEPRFTFHGFRYVELTGLATPPALAAVEGIVLNSDMDQVGAWQSSDPMLNRLYSNIVWGQRSNYLEVPTDCPQRDERMGWSGDAQAFIGTGIYNFDVRPFFTAWLNTFNDSQDAAGGYPNVSPKHYGVSPAWGDAGVICPWTIWRMTGDTRIITDHWSGMVKWLDYLEKRSNDLVRPDEGFGDWLNLGAEMPRDVISTAYFAYVSTLMAEMAEATGNQQDAARYADLAKRIRVAFNKAFVKPDGRIKGDTQTTYLMALGFDLIPHELRKPAADRLVELLKERDWHLSTGFLGVNLLLPVLTEIGRPDIAWRLLTVKTYPGWLYPVTQGATTIWERWDGWRHDKGFQDAGMNSFNHYAYGSCGQWMFAHAAGIDTAGGAFSRIRICPTPGGGVQWIRASYNSARGPVAVEWRRGARGTRSLALSVTVPANATAEIWVPAVAARCVTEGGKALGSAPGVEFKRMSGNYAVVEVGAGSYRFASSDAGVAADKIPQ